MRIYYIARYVSSYCKVSGEKISKILFSSSLIVWFYLINTVELKISTLGLIETFWPMLFFASVLLTIPFILSLRYVNNAPFIFAHILALISFLYLTPVLVENTIRFYPTYVFHGNVYYTLTQAKINFEIEGYQRLLGSVLLVSTLASITGVDTLTLFKLGPAMLQIIILVPLYYLFKKLGLERKLTWTALWLYYVSDWLQDYALLPHSIAIRAYLFALAVGWVIMFRNLRNMEMAKYLLIFCLLSTVLPTMHIVTAIVLLLGFFPLIILKLVRGPARKKSLLLLAILFLQFAPLYYMAKDILGPIDVAITKIWNTLLGIKDPVPYNPLSPILISDFYTKIQLTFQSAYMAFSRNMVVNLTKLLLAVVVSTLAMVGLITSIRDGKKGQREKAGAMLILLISSGVMPFFFTTWGGEAPMRLYCYVLPFIACVASYSMYRPKLRFALLFILLIAPPLHTVAAYGNEIADYVPKSEVKTYDFISELGKVLMMQYGVKRFGITSLIHHVAFYRDIETRIWTPLMGFFKNVDGNLTFRAGSSFYVVESLWEIKAYTYLNVEPQSMSSIKIIKNLPGYHLIYSNGNDNVYRNSG